MLGRTTTGQLENDPHRRGTEIAFIESAVIGVPTAAIRQRERVAAALATRIRISSLGIEIS